MFNIDSKKNCIHKFQVVVTNNLTIAKHFRALYKLFFTFLDNIYFTT